MLNVRYIIVPTSVSPGRDDLRRLVEEHPVVFADDRVKVLENREALPRAWIVHEARRVGPGEALPLLAAGTVDPRRTALLELEPPPLAPSADPSAERAAIVSYAPDRMRLRVRSDAPGLLMLSEIYYPAWQASVDGEPVPLFVADHALRAVPVPAGEHTVELRYESAALRASLMLSLAFSVALASLAATAGWRRWRRNR